MDAQIAAIEYAHKLATTSPSVVLRESSVDVNHHVQDLHKRLKQIAENLREEIISQASAGASMHPHPCSKDTVNRRQVIDTEVQTSEPVTVHAEGFQDDVLARPPCKPGHASCYSLPTTHTTHLSAAHLFHLPGLPTDTTYSVSEHLASSRSEQAGSSLMHAATMGSGNVGHAEVAAMSMPTASVPSETVPADDAESCAPSYEAGASDVASAESRRIFSTDATLQSDVLFQWFQTEAEEQNNCELACLNEGIDKTCRATKRALAQIRAAKQKLEPNDSKHNDLDKWETWLLLQIEQSKAGIQQRRILLQQQLQQQKLFWHFVATAVRHSGRAGAVSAETYQWALRFAVESTGGLTSQVHDQRLTDAVSTAASDVYMKAGDHSTPVHSPEYGSVPTASSVGYSLEYEEQSGTSWTAAVPADVDAAMCIHSSSSSVAAEGLHGHPDCVERTIHLNPPTVPSALNRQVQELRARVAHKQDMKNAHDEKVRLQRELQILRERNAHLDAELAAAQHPDAMESSQVRYDVALALRKPCENGHPSDSGGSSSAGAESSAPKSTVVEVQCCCWISL